MLFKFREKSWAEKNMSYLSISTHPGRFILEIKMLLV